MAALIFVLTRMVQIATPAKGYIHMGDAGIVFAALSFGPGVAAVAGGLGTALSDITSGYAQWALFSLLIHGLQGYLVAVIARHKVNSWTLTLGVIASTLVVVVGYFLTGTLLMGLAAAVTEILPNIIQGISGGLVGVPLYIAVSRAYPPLLRYTHHSS
jgi:uncharacterized membrane protein